MKARRKPAEIDYFEVVEETFFAKGLLELTKWVESFGDVFEHNFRARLPKYNQDVNMYEIDIFTEYPKTACMVSTNVVIVRFKQGNYKSILREAFFNEYEKI